MEINNQLRPGKQYCTDRGTVADCAPSMVRKLLKTSNPKFGQHSALFVGKFTTESNHQRKYCTDRGTVADCLCRGPLPLPSHMHNLSQLPRCTDLSTALCKAIAVICSVAASLPAGLEGPMILLGLAIGENINRLVPTNREASLLLSIELFYCNICKEWSGLSPYTSTMTAMRR